ncbi:MAG TPA: ASCH domain-containing protein, partial [Oscillospiraceae bacterium]|nr:ASCH domain-containing protein [Oscillospiraceae bacterium]
MDRIEAFWQDFLRETGRGADTRRADCFSFGLTPQDADELLALVLSGRKRATTSSLRSFRGAALPRPGDLSIVTDGAGDPRCVVETTAVSVLLFSEMDWATCRREGEDEALASWRAGHRRFFEAEGATLGYRFSENIPIVFEDFRVVYDPTRQRGALLLPPHAAQVIARLHAAGHEAWAVGGWVRDALRGETPHDVDIATNAPPETVRSIFAGSRVLDTGLKHGTVSVRAGDAFLEITTYRAEGPYSDGRRPDSVRFVGSLREDLSRRDFTVNAMAWDGRTLEDPFDGAADLERRLIRCVGDPDARFSEDALRILRALRFASVLGFSIEGKTRAALFRSAPALAHISHERTAAELTGLLCGENEM